MALQTQGSRTRWAPGATLLGSHPITAVLDGRFHRAHRASTLPQPSKRSPGPAPSLAWKDATSGFRRGARHSFHLVGTLLSTNAIFHLGKDFCDEKTT